MYSVGYKCHNCYHTCFVNIPFRQEAPVWYECPRCGMNTLMKTEKVVDSYYYYEEKKGRLESSPTKAP
jgi:hypothetical protein